MTQFGTITGTSSARGCNDRHASVRRANPLSAGVWHVQDRRSLCGRATWAQATKTVWPLVDTPAAPSVFVVVLFFGLPFFVALVLPAARNLLFGPDFSVRFVLPNDYVGEFKVVLDPSQGADYSRDGREFAFRIPANDILRVISDGPLNSFDRQNAVYEDGREVVFKALASDGDGHRY